MARFKSKPADEHPRPHVDVPMEIFGESVFRVNYELVGKLVHAWCSCVWKKDPRFFWAEVFSEHLDALVRAGFVVIDSDGKPRLTGPKREIDWLLSAKRTYRTYAIEAMGQGLVKVGKALDPEARLQNLQVGSAHPLRIVGVIEKDIEQKVHRRLWDKWTAGEWFVFDDFTRGVLADEGLL